MTDEQWMQIALQEAETAAGEGEVPVGAVVVKNDALLSKAHNLCMQAHNPTMHAECLALKDAFQKVGLLQECTMYVTLEPCTMCAGTMLHYGLSRLVFGAYEPVTGCCGSKIDLTDHWFDGNCKTIGGVCETDCQALLQSFFSELRV